MSSVKYNIGNYAFLTKEFFPESLFAMITDVRVKRPQVIKEEALRRKKRRELTIDGRLTILAADHPARNVTGIAEDPIAMGNRYEYIGRILRVITSEEFDGVMGTPDIIEDLLIVNRLFREKSGESFLDDKVLLGCMNRGGLNGAIFELDDRMTAYTPESIAEFRLDGAKLMFRLDLSEQGSLLTIEYCSSAINELVRRNIPVFLEALWVEKIEGKYKTKKSANELIKVIGIATALGETSSNTWLKVPYCDDYERVSRATTCPILMLGGESRGDPTGIINEFSNGMKAGASIRGALVGRNVTFPGKDDPSAVASSVYKIVHEGLGAEMAVDYLLKNRGINIDYFTKYFK